MRLTTLILSASCLLAALPAIAADNVGTLRTALGQIPESVLSGNDPMPISYLDVKTMAKVENGALSEGALRRVSFSRFIRPLDTLMYGGRNFADKAGIAFEDVTYFAGYGQPPSRLSYWGLADTTATATLFDALLTREFREVQATPRMLANGEPRAISFVIRDGENPWLGDLGQSSYVIARGHAVIQTSAPEDFKPILEMKRAAADNGAIDTALQGLEKAKVAEGATIIQAMVITPLFGLSTVDTSDLLSGDPADLEAVKKKLEARIADNARGIPPYLTGILADTQKPGGPALVVSLAYGDCATAETAVTAIQKRWAEASDVSRLLGLTGDTVPAKDGLCAAVVSFDARGKSNSALSEAFSRYMRRDFNFLQIGNPG